MLLNEPIRPLDHLVYVCGALAEGVARSEALLGVHPSPGGRHEGLGTHNALVGLGDGCYLEIVAPDPRGPDPALPRWFGLDEPPDTPFLATWAARSAGLERLTAVASGFGVDLGTVSTGGRIRPDGVPLSWRLTDPRADRLGGAVPFFIDWGDAPHPSVSLAHGCRLLELEVAHPEAGRLERVVRALGLDVRVVEGSVPAVRARIESPGGTVMLG